MGPGCLRMKLRFFNHKAFDLNTLVKFSAAHISRCMVVGPVMLMVTPHLVSPDNYIRNGVCCLVPKTLLTNCCVMSPLTIGYPPWLWGILLDYGVSPLTMGYPPRLWGIRLDYGVSALTMGYPPWLWGIPLDYGVSPLTMGYPPWLWGIPLLLRELSQTDIALSNFNLSRYISEDSR